MKKMFSLFVLIVLSSAGCFLNFETVKVIEPTGARKFSDEIAKLVVDRRFDELYSQMDDDSKKYFSREELPPIFDQIKAHFGELIETRYKTEEIGYWVYPDGKKKPMRKYWYATKTSKAETGKYFLYVAVVQNDDKFACARFSMEDFPEQLPPNLQ